MAIGIKTRIEEVSRECLASRITGNSTDFADNSTEDVVDLQNLELRGCLASKNHSTLLLIHINIGVGAGGGAER